MVLACLARKTDGRVRQDASAGFAKWARCRCI